jgi:hypothetical protein
MDRLVVFVSTYPVIAGVWFVGMSVSIGFSILAGARHRRNVKEGLAMRGQHPTEVVRQSVEECAPAKSGCARVRFWPMNPSSPALVVC